LANQKNDYTCVSTVLNEGSWNWPPARSDDLVAIQVRLPNVKIGEADVAVWKSKSGVYSCGETWNFLRPKFPVVPWWKVVWHHMAIPRHAFVLWLVFRQAIATKEKICGWGFMGHTLYRFCFHVQESIDHLFFQCGFSRHIWRNLMADCLSPSPIVSWDDIVLWACSLKGKRLHTTLCKLGLAAAVYHIWRFAK
jgi:hypothetical protein